MRRKNEQPKASEFAFQPVNATFQVSGGALRGEDGALIHPSGFAKLNAGGSEALDALAVQAGLPVGQYAVRFGVDPERELIAAYVIESGAEGAMPVMRSGKGNVISLHMGGVFADYPLLRPAGKRTCVVMSRLDVEGKPCLIFALQTSLAARRTSRTRADTQALPPAAGAEIEGPAE